MQIRQVPTTDLKVSALCLGGNVFGWSADKQTSFQILDRFEALGGNFIDTADVYSEWVPGNRGGESEEIIGEWLKGKNRADFVIATKVAKLSTRPGLSAKNIIAACDDSLKRLGTDHIDLYYAHHFDQEVDQLESLRAFNQLMESGKVRYIAASQHSAAQLKSAQSLAADNGLHGYSALQNEYNLLERKAYEEDSAPALEQLGIGSFPFFGLARGFLTGKYLQGDVQSVRAESVKDYDTDKNRELLKRLETVALAHNVSIAAIALSWLSAQSTVISPIASARTTLQLEEISKLVSLSPEELSFIG